MAHWSPQHRCAARASSCVQAPETDVSDWRDWKLAPQNKRTPHSGGPGLVSSLRPPEANFLPPLSQARAAERATL
eukprot:1630235-Heterocapsa_arctica.AAC.1